MCYIYSHSFIESASGHGGIGRRVTLRSLWAKPVEVQVFLTAPLLYFKVVKFYLYEGSYMFRIYRTEDNGKLTKQKKNKFE